jgi:hypothetical protein
VQTYVLRRDSKVVLGQIEKECIAREPTLERYLALVGRMESYFNRFIVEYIERNKNAKVDDLVKAAARNTLMSTNVFFQVLKDALVKTVLPEPRVINIIKEEDCRALIMEYLHHYSEPDSKNKLYKTSVLGPSFIASVKPKVKKYSRKFTQEFAKVTLVSVH